MHSEGTTQQPNGSALLVWWFKPFPSFCSHYIGIKSSFVKFKKQPKRDAAFAKMALSMRTKDSPIAKPKRKALA